MSHPGPSVAAALQEAAARLAKSPQYADWRADEVPHQTRYEAEQLLCHLTQWSKLELLQRLSDGLPNDVEDAYVQLVQTRMTGMPLAYILGHTDFYGRVFRTRPVGLIPRPDTEVLVDVARTWIQRHAPAGTVVDVGTGSGCIAITLALECPEARVYAVDISRDALALAQENCALNDARVTWVEEDGIRWLEESSRVNVIVSNPPYIPTGDVKALESGVRSYEPRLALDGGSDGLDFYRAFAGLTPAVFQPNCPAALFFEVGAGQAQDVANLFSNNEEWLSFTVQILPDMRGIERIVAILREG